MKKPINTSIDTTSWTAVELHTGQICSAYVISTRTKTAIKISDTEDGTDYFTLHEGRSIGLMERHSKDFDKTLFYAQAVDTDDVVEVCLVLDN